MFQAKHTLKSIIDNYDPNADDEIIDLATAKYDSIIEKEKKEQEEKGIDEIELNFEGNSEGQNELFEEKPDTITF